MAHITIAPAAFNHARRVVVAQWVLQHILVNRKMCGCVHPTIGFPIKVAIQYRIHTLPHTGPRVVVPCPEVIQPGLLVQFLAGEEVRRPQGVAVFLHPGLSEGEVFHVFIDVSLGIGDVACAAQVVRVVVVEELLGLGCVRAGCCAVDDLAVDDGVAFPFQVLVDAVFVAFSVGEGVFQSGFTVTRQVADVDVVTVGGKASPFSRQN